MSKISVNDVGNRNFLIDLKQAARQKSNQVANQSWKCAYNSLAQAADHCDAINARSEDTSDDRNKGTPE